MKKILIAYASYGSGHKTIANYIKDYLDNSYEIKIIDILDYTKTAVNISLKIFNYIYLKKLDKCFTFCYKSLDNDMSINNYRIFFKRFIINNDLIKIYKDFNPDIVISTHFFGNNIASYLNKKKIINSKIITVVPDYKAHKFWWSSKDSDEIFVVANEIVKNEMIKRGCISSNIYPFGLPYNEKKLINLASKKSIYEKYNISLNKHIILFFAGGSYGRENTIKYLKILSKLNLNYEILFICGKNENLEIKTKNMFINNENVKILGFINNIYELIDIADLVITKPGGATITECLEMQKFMLLLPGMGGQEEYNAKFVCKNNYGLLVNNRLTFILFIKKYLKNDLYKNIYNNNNKIKNNSLSKIKKLVDKLN